MIRGITFDNQMFYSADFAHFLNFFLDGSVGTTKGCSITHDGTKVTIGKGYFIAQGRLMNVEVEEVIEASQGFASGYNRIVYEIDLSKENTISEFKQGVIKVLNTEELVQEDLDAGGTIYQLPICHFQWSGTAISNFGVDVKKLEEPSFDQPAIEIDGAICSGKLKLSTKYQWVADKDTCFAGDDTSKIYVSYKNKVHMICNSGAKHYRLDETGWVEDVTPPTTGDAINMVAWEHGEYLYYMYQLALYRFDGTAWTKVLDIPSKETSTSYLTYLHKRVPAINGDKVYLSFQTRAGKSTYTYYSYCGYIDLSTMEWVDIATLPYPSGAMLGFISGELYAIGGNSNTTTSSNVYKLNGSSWTQILSLSCAINTDDSYCVLQSNKLYMAIKGYEIVSFDGTKLENIVDIDEFSMPYLISNNGRIHLFGCRTWTSSYSGSYQFYGSHQVLAKVLCLED